VPARLNIWLAAGFDFGADPMRTRLTVLAVILGAALVDAIGCDVLD
jgi:hypothetical protein